MTANNPPLAAAASIAAVQQVQSLIKFDVPVLEGDSEANWLTWSQNVVYQARVCSFEAELKEAEGGGLSVGADVFDGTNVDPLRLRNIHVAWMTLNDNCRGVALEIVQRSEAPNGAWRNLESYLQSEGNNRDTSLVTRG